MPDLRRTFEYITRTWGTDILLQRRIPFAGSGVYESPPTSQFSSKLEKYTIRFFYARHSGMAAVPKERGEGVVHTPEMLAYFPWNSKVKEGDRLYVKDERFAGNMTTFIISYANDYYGVNGRVEYVGCGLLRETPN